MQENFNFGSCFRSMEYVALAYFCQVFFVVQSSFSSNLYVLVIELVKWFHLVSMTFVCALCSLHMLAPCMVLMYCLLLLVQIRFECLRHNNLNLGWRPARCLSKIIMLCFAHKKRINWFYIR